MASSTQWMNVWCLSPAPVPLRGAEEAVSTRHGPHHPAGQQLVSTHIYTHTHRYMCVTYMVHIWFIYGETLGFYTEFYMMRSTWWDLHDEFYMSSIWWVMNVVSLQVHKRQEENSSAHDRPVQQSRWIYSSCLKKQFVILKSCSKWIVGG